MRYIVLLISFILIACSDPVDQCVQRKQDSWRKNNPNADHGKAITANEKFRKECNNYKK